MMSVFAVDIRDTVKYKDVMKEYPLHYLITYVNIRVIAVFYFAFVISCYLAEYWAV